MHRRFSSKLAVLFLVLTVLAACITFGLTGHATFASSVTSSATQTSTIVDYGAAGYRYEVVPIGANPGFQNPAYNDQAFSNGAGAFGVPLNGCPLDSTIKTDWASNTDILVRRDIDIPAGTMGLTIHLAIDNNAVVYWNGTQVGSVAHGGCAARDSLIASVPNSALVVGANVLAIRGTDLGASTYLDLQVVATASPPTPTPAKPSACPTGTTLSGASWTQQFPGSNSLNDLQEPFRTSAKQFITALTNAHTKPTITATLRPALRAWLMHYSYDIVSKNAKYHIDPRKVSANPNISICWIHTNPDGSYNQQASVAAALAMVNAYGISPFKKSKPLLTPPSLTSNHISGWAMDMVVSWTGTLTIKDASGKVVNIRSGPRTDMNTQLWSVAASYGVYHFGTNKSNAAPSKDALHWSINGK